MRLRIRKDKLIYICITVVLCVFMYAFYLQFNYNMPLEKGLNILTLICCMIYFWILASAYKMSMRINLYFVLVAMTIPFYLGDQLSLLLGFKDLMLQSDHSIIDGIIQNQHIYSAMFLLMASLLALHLGYLCIYNRPQNEESDSISNIKHTSMYYKMRIVGIVIYFVSVIPAIIVRIYDVYMSIILGHLTYRLQSGEYTSTFIYYMDYIADWFIPSCLILLIFCKNKFERNFSLVSIIIYCLLYILSGNRMEILGIVISTICIYVYWYKVKVTRKQLIKYGIGLLVIVFVFQIVGAARNISGGLSMFSSEFVREILKKNFLYSIFETTGNTFTSIANTIKCVPKFVSFNNGKSVLGSILYILPSSLREPYLSKIITHISAVLSPYYYGWTISGYGSSFITEAYFNFSYLGVLVIALYGGIVAKIIKGIENVDYTKAFRFYFCIYMVWELTDAIRNDLYFVPRHLVLYVLLPYVLTLFLSRKVKR